MIYDQNANGKVAADYNNIQVNNSGLTLNSWQHIVYVQNR